MTLSNISNAAAGPFPRHNVAVLRPFNLRSSRGRAMSITKFTLAGFLFAFGALAARADERLVLAKKAREILQTNCYRCHGLGSSGGFDAVLDVQRMLENGIVVANDPTKSPLFKRLQSSDRPMPPKGVDPRPSAADIRTIRAWIEAGAPDFAPTIVAREFVPPAAILTKVHDHLAAAPVRERPFLRYFTLANVHNAGVPADELHRHRAGLAKLLNSLSWQRRIVPPIAIDANEIILRVDLRDYGWNSKTWDNLVKDYPFGILTETSEEKAIADMTKTKLAAVRADWFVFAASQPPLYHDILSLPKSQPDLEKVLQLDTTEAIRVGRISRAAFNASGVANHNRVVQRTDSAYGAFWVSFDFKSSVGAQNIFDRPLGPGKADKEFLHDAGEIIFNLPNGLQAYFLVDGSGKRIDRATTDLVTDPVQKDKVVVNGVSCMSCHAGGIIPARDQVRAHVSDNSSSFSDSEKDAILSLYPGQERFQALVAEDSKRFRTAVNLAIGAPSDSPLPTVEPITAVACRFEQEMDLATVAAEASVPTHDFLQMLHEAPALARVFGPVRTNGGTIQRQVFLAHFKELASALKLGTYIEPQPPVAAKAENPDSAASAMSSQSPGSSPERTAKVANKRLPNQDDALLQRLHEKYDRLLQNP